MLWKHKAVGTHISGESVTHDEGYLKVLLMEERGTAARCSSSGWDLSPPGDGSAGRRASNITTVSILPQFRDAVRSAVIKVRRE